MRFGLKTNQHHLTWPELSSRVRYAEDQGFDGAWLFDHLKAMAGDEPGPCMEAWTLLAALASTTDNKLRVAATTPARARREGHGLGSR